MDRSSSREARKDPRQTPSHTCKRKWGLWDPVAHQVFVDRLDLKGSWVPRAMLGTRALLVLQAPKAAVVCLVCQGKRVKRAMMASPALLVRPAALESGGWRACLESRGRRVIEVFLDWMELKETSDRLEKKEKMDQLVQWAQLVLLVLQDPGESGVETALPDSLACGV